MLAVFNIIPCTGVKLQKQSKQSMKINFRRILSTILLILIPTAFCSLLSSPISYGLPLNCPAESRVIGIECFDAKYNNTTPWYRRDFGASELTFPFWLVGYTVLVLFVVSRTSSSPDAEQRKNVPSPAPKPPQIQRKLESVPSKRWLPTNCPHCGGSISAENVEWISDYEAKCPYCESVLKE